MANAFDLATVLADVSNSDTANQYRVSMIPLLHIYDDPKNFYSVKDTHIDELAANIETVGLQQPIVVRPHDNLPDRYVIISGHRRRAAYTVLAQDNADKYGSIPCIVDSRPGSAALRELQLIYANSATRTLSAADLTKQVERVEELLYQLKESGMEFPGRMRDHVAKACNVSKTKIARLEAIRKHLCHDVQQHFSQGELNESVAYELSKLPEDLQKRIVSGYIDQSRKLSWMSVGEVQRTALHIENTAAISCPHKLETCQNRERMIDKICSMSSSYTSPCAKCCAKCDNLRTCKSSCQLCEAKKVAQKEQLKQAKKAEAEAQAQKDQPALDALRAIWARFGELRKDSGLSIEQVLEGTGRYYYTTMEPIWLEREQGTFKFTPYTEMPYNVRLDFDIIRNLIASADLFGCSIDYLLCRTDSPADNEPAPARWIPGDQEPKKPMQAVCQFQVNDKVGDTLTTIAYWHAGGWRFLKSQETIICPCVKYFPIPEDE